MFSVLSQVTQVSPELKYSPEWFQIPRLFPVLPCPLRGGECLLDSVGMCGYLPPRSECHVFKPQHLKWR